MPQDSDIRRREVVVSQSVIEGWQSQLKSRMVQIERLEKERESLKKLIEAGRLVLMNSEIERIREDQEREAARQGGAPTADQQQSGG